MPKTHISVGDVPTFDDIPVVAIERRRRPDRRRAWRGGRRDSDWLNRPPGVLARVSPNTPRWLTWWAMRG
jgi:hypothetical protein